MTDPKETAVDHLLEDKGPDPDFALTDEEIAEILGGDAEEGDAEEGDAEEASTDEPVKRKRGRPRNNPEPEVAPAEVTAEVPGTEYYEPTPEIVPPGELSAQTLLEMHAGRQALAARIPK
jgi:hypothetical protein